MNDSLLRTRLKISQPEYYRITLNKWYINGKAMRCGSIHVLLLKVSLNWRSMEVSSRIHAGCTVSRGHTTYQYHSVKCYLGRHQFSLQWDTMGLLLFTNSACVHQWIWYTHWKNQNMYKGDKWDADLKTAQHSWKVSPRVEIISNFDINDVTSELGRQAHKGTTTMVWSNQEGVWISTTYIHFNSKQNLSGSDKSYTLPE